MLWGQDAIEHGPNQEETMQVIGLAMQHGPMLAWMLAPANEHGPNQDMGKDVVGRECSRART